MRLRHACIEVSAARGVCRTLLAIVATSEDNDNITFDESMVYLHGFPDMSVHPTEVKFASRMAAKLAECWVNQKDRKHVFVTFNFGGVPGSDKELRFTDKRISLEVEDAIVVCKYVRSHFLGGKGKVHTVGLSTGAIVGALLRDKSVSDTVTVIAGLLDMTKGVHFDFNKEQLKQAEKQGWCWKEFYLEENCPLPKNVELSLDGVQATTALTDANAPSKIYIRLDKNYIDEFFEGSLDISKAVSGICLPPLLVIHGDADTDVPHANGEELFAAAADLKSFLLIPKANHMLSNSKHIKIALREIREHVAVLH
ncbi:putative alpha/Beta hydrolase [Plasmopara halstedii]